MYCLQNVFFSLTFLTEDKPPKEDEERMGDDGMNEFSGSLEWVLSIDPVDIHLCHGEVQKS